MKQTLVSSLLTRENKDLGQDLSRVEEEDKVLKQRIQSLLDIDGNLSQEQEQLFTAIAKFKRSQSSNDVVELQN